MPATPSPSAPLRRPRWPRRVAAVVAAAVLVTSGVAWGAVARYSDKLNQLELGLGSSSVAQGNPVTILVVASDDRTGLSKKERRKLHVGQDDYGRHTDTMMLVHLSADSSSVSVVSLPRDTLATIPAHTDSDGKHHGATQAKLNAAYAIGGAPLMIETVQDLTGVRIDHYVEVNFQGFLAMVDALDGVEVCLPTATKDEKSGLDLPAGKQTVSGKQALAYVRARYFDPTADLGRMQRQQKFVASMAKKALSAGTLLNPIKLDAFLSAVSSSITTDSGLGRTELLDLAERTASVSPSQIQFTTVPLGEPKRVQGLGDVLTWDTKAANALFAKINADQPLNAPAASTDRSQITLQVSNGTSIAGLGARAAKDLTGIGFAMAGDPDNASEPVGSATVVRYSGDNGASADAVAAVIPGATVEQVDGLGGVIGVVVGSSYNGVSAKAGSGKSGSAKSGTKNARSAADNLCG